MTARDAESEPLFQTEAHQHLDNFKCRRVLPGTVLLVASLSAADMVDQSENSFVMDLLMLVHSSSFIGTASSNVGRFVFFMRAGDKPSVSLDEDFTERNC